jgi:hypothetical protein
MHEGFIVLSWGSDLYGGAHFRLAARIRRGQGPIALREGLGLFVEAVARESEARRVVADGSAIAWPCGGFTQIALQWPVR